ncbi:hypothetical protein [Flavobacterium sandaracinum]|nr:hypothetical protein [Flavobacterium sandaracinum]
MKNPFEIIVEKLNSIEEFFEEIHQDKPIASGNELMDVMVYPIRGEIQD